MRITTTSSFAIAAALSLTFGAVQTAAAQKTFSPRSITMPNPAGAISVTRMRIPIVTAVPRMPTISRVLSTPIGEISRNTATSVANTPSTSVVNPDSMMPTAIVVDPKTGASVLNPDSMMPGTMVPPSVHASSSNHESSDEDLVGLLPFFDEGHVTGSDPTPHP